MRNKTPTRLDLALPNIKNWFEASVPRVYDYGHLAQLLEDKRSTWEIPRYVSVPRFISFLLEKTPLSKIKISPTGDVSATSLERFTWGEVEPLVLALSVRNNSYLTHASAMFLHGLTDQIPRTIFINKEQSAKRFLEEVELSQAAIDAAFARKQRESHLIFQAQDIRIIVTSGKNVGRFGVLSLPIKGAAVEVTSLQRTLVDICVRPTYSGGTFQVFEAYKRARQHVSAESILEVLGRLRYVYPYHQAIGFYMQRADYPETEYSKLKELGLHYDFYLAHGLKETTYIPEWRLHVPVGF